MRCPVQRCVVRSRATPHECGGPQATRWNHHPQPDELIGQPIPVHENSPPAWRGSKQECTNVQLHQQAGGRGLHSSFPQGCGANHFILVPSRGGFRINLACLMQALVENIPWRDARLAYDSMASIACRMLAVRSRAAGSLKMCRVELRWRARR
jgi:hypothetical protein